MNLAPPRRSLRHLAALALAAAALAALYLWGLDRPLLWSDEADTGIEARGVREHGLPSPFDGRNLSLFDNGSQLSRGFLSKKIPWVQYYVGAASLALFGDDTRGLRLLFALLGLSAWFPLRALLRGRVRAPDLAAALLLLAPQIVLFQRNARYYSLLVLGYAVLLWLLSAPFRRPWIRPAGVGAVFVLLFHTQPFAAACAGGSLFLFALLFRRGEAAALLLAAVAGFASWLAWYAALGPGLAASATTLESITSDFSGWLSVFADGLFAMVLDLDAVGAVPLLLLAVALGMALPRRSRVLGLLREPLVGLVGINLVVQAVATAGLLGYETADRFAILRYMPHLLLFSLAGLAVALEGLGTGGAALAALAVAVLSNLASASFWIQPRAGRVPLSWMPAVAGEIFHPPPDALAAAVGELRASAPPGAPAPVLFVSPAWARDTAIFYLGDRFLISPEFTPGPAERGVMDRVAGLMGPPAFRRAIGAPDWVLSLGHYFTAPRGYALAASFPSPRARPDDGARPELTRHSFPQAGPAGTVQLYRRSPLSPSSP
ncbi:MAG TPA: hypothetical protein VHC86_00425 [Opitutaceae bacterium]|nr:hypothetical protein [Opitutaceae bacterium]